LGKKKVQARKRSSAAMGDVIQGSIGGKVWNPKAAQKGTPGGSQKRPSHFADKEAKQAAIRRP